MLELFHPKLDKLVSKLKLKLEKYIFLELVICSNSNANAMKNSNLMKFELGQALVM